MNRKACEREAGLAVKFALVGLVGFVVDALVLHAGLTLHLPPAVARAASILCAMQVTFVINGLYIFRCLTWRSCAGHWWRYMLTNGFGNLCSYLVFIALVSLHQDPWSRPWLAFPASTACAYVINFTGARLLVFGRALREREARRPAAETRTADRQIGQSAPSPPFAPS